MKSALTPSKIQLQGFAQPLRKHRKTFVSVYQDIRNKIFAHKLLNSRDDVTTLISKAQKADIEDMLNVLDDFLHKLADLYLNGIWPKATLKPVSHKDRVKDRVASLLDTLNNGYAKKMNRVMDSCRASVAIQNPKDSLVFADHKGRGTPFHAHVQARP